MLLKYKYRDALNRCQQLFIYLSLCYSILPLKGEGNVKALMLLHKGAAPATQLYLF